MFHDTRTASADQERTQFGLASEPDGDAAGDRAWALSSHGALSDRASDIPVASPSCALGRRTFVRASEREGAAEATLAAGS